MTDKDRETKKELIESIQSILNANKDNSPFYDIGIFKNKKYFNSFIKKLGLEGYKKEGI